MADGEGEVGGFLIRLAGTLLCSLWVAVSYVDQAYLVNRMRDAARFRWTHLSIDANVLLTMAEDTQAGRNIYGLARAVALLFYLLHLIVLGYYLQPALMSLVE